MGIPSSNKSLSAPLDSFQGPAPSMSMSHQGLDHQPAAPKGELPSGPVFPHSLLIPWSLPPYLAERENFTNLCQNPQINQAVIPKVPKEADLGMPMEY